MTTVLPRYVLTTSALAGAGGLASVVGTLLPWARLTDSVYGDGYACPISAWSRVPLFGAIVVALGLLTIGLSARTLSTKRPLTRTQATWLGILGALILASVGAWLFVVLRTPDPARVDPGFEYSRTIPWLGAGLVCLSALVAGTTGVVARVLPFVSGPAPMNEGHGVDVKALLRRHRPDPEWSKDLADVRSVVEIEDRP